MTPHRVVIVGGGAGGLELATRLGNRYGRRGGMHITLVDATLTHLWKPLLHEVAAGTFDSHENAVDYIAQAHRHHFKYRLGRMDGLDRERREVRLAPTDDADGRPLIPRRVVPYDTLVMAVGSVSHDFGIPGVREHCVFLDDRAQADALQQVIMRNYIRAQTQEAPVAQGQLGIVIIGAGATGVELAAELHHVARQLAARGFDRIVPERDVGITIIEAAGRLLPALPERLSSAAEKELRRLGVAVQTGKRVVRVIPEGVQTDDGMFHHAQLAIWAAGIKAPDFLRDIASLETNRLDQLMLRPTLQTTRDESIFAIGDCAALPLANSDRPVPPTAQAAHQQAARLVKSLRCRIANKALPEFRYHDRGTLVSLSHYATVGNLMGNLTGSVMIEGRIARLTYRMLYRMHQRALHGIVPTGLLMLSDLLQHRIRPRLKLH